MGNYILYYIYGGTFVESNCSFHGIIQKNFEEKRYERNIITWFITTFVFINYQYELKQKEEKTTNGDTDERKT